MGYRNTSTQPTLKRMMSLIQSQWLYHQICIVYLSLPLLISLFILFNLSKRTKSKKPLLNLPPFPPKLPIIGNMHQFGALPHRSLRDLSLIYGDIMMFQMGQSETPKLVVSSAEVAREIMKKHDLAFSHRAQITPAKVLIYECKDVGFARYGEDWRHKRKIAVHHFLSSKMVESCRHVREQVAADLVNNLRQASSSDAPSVNLSQMLTSTFSKIIYKNVFRRKYSEQNSSWVTETINKVMDHLATFTVSDPFPLLGFVDVLMGKIQQFKSTFKTLDARLDQAIANQLSVNTDSKDKDFVDSLLNSEFTQTDIKAIITDLFVGGTDTMTSTVEWAMSELMRHPIIMKKVQEEVRTVVGNKSNVEENDVNQMHYLKCVIKEILRLHPPNPILGPRQTLSSVNLKGYDIPENTTVIINAWAIHRDPRLWEKAEEFLPERFENSEIDFKGQECFQFIPFGFGRRGCAGMNFAIASIEYVLANLLYWFDWNLPQTDKDIDMGEIFGFAVTKKVPLHLKPKTFSF